MPYLIILALGLPLSFFFPWWVLAPVSWVVCFWKAKSAGTAFIQSAAAMISIWMAYALCIQIQSPVPFVGKIAGILTGKPTGLGHLASNAMVYGLCLFIALLVGGLAGFAGFQMKKFGRGS